MKKILIILLIGLFTFNSSQAYINIKSRITIDTKQGYNLDKLRFGIDQLATTSLDTSLGELEVPPFKPPEGINAGFIIFDKKQNENIWTYTDLRPYPEKPYDTVFYNLTVLKGNGDLCTLSWNPLFPEILSAIIVDALTGGAVVKINMKDSTKAFVNNEFIEQFVLKVVYDPATYIEEDNLSNDEHIKANIIKDELNLISDNLLQCYELYNLDGNRIIGETINCNEFNKDISNLPSGLYFVVVEDNIGKFFVRKFIKK